MRERRCDSANAVRQFRKVSRFEGTRSKHIEEIGVYLSSHRLHDAGKMVGQRANLVRLRITDLGSFDAMREALDRADSIADVRLCEAKAAAIYWNAWSSVPIRLRGRDLAKVPARWARYDARSSVLTGAPRGDQSGKCVAQLHVFAARNGIASRTARRRPRPDPRRSPRGPAKS